MPAEVIEARWHRFMAAQQEVSAARLAKRVGQTLTVLVDEVGEDEIIARSAADAPEIDGNVFLPPTKGVKAGDWLKVTISAAEEYDLFGEVA